MFGGSATTSAFRSLPCCDFYFSIPHMLGLTFNASGKRRIETRLLSIHQRLLTHSSELEQYPSRPCQALGPNYQVNPTYETFLELLAMFLNVIETMAALAVQDERKTWNICPWMLPGYVAPISITSLVVAGSCSALQTHFMVCGFHFGFGLREGFCRGWFGLVGGLSVMNCDSPVSLESMIL